MNWCEKIGVTGVYKVPVPKCAKKKKRRLCMLTECPPPNWAGSLLPGIFGLLTVGWESFSEVDDNSSKLIRSAVTERREEEPYQSGKKKKSAFSQIFHQYWSLGGWTDIPDKLISFSLTGTPLPLNSRGTWADCFHEVIINIAAKIKLPRQKII